MDIDSINIADWEDPVTEHRSLRLFVAGSSPASVRAINNLTVILNKVMGDKYELEIVDIYQQPDLANQENITAVPLLIKKAPVPKRLLIGDMSNIEKVLRGLGLFQSNTP